MSGNYFSSLYRFWYNIHHSGIVLHVSLVFVLSMREEMHTASKIDISHYHYQTSGKFNLTDVQTISLKHLYFFSLRMSIFFIYFFFFMGSFNSKQQQCLNESDPRPKLRWWPRKKKKKKRNPTAGSRSFSLMASDCDCIKDSCLY